MTQHHPDLPAEQAHIDHAYEMLAVSRKAAWRLRDLSEADLGGTFQARFERNAFDEALLRRLEDLELGNAALVFGRIDRLVDDADEHTGTVTESNVEGFHIGRLAVADADAEPVVVDWRAPVAEPFYRATGRNRMGLVRRRHFAVEGQRLLGIEDELFGDGHLGVGHDDGLADGETEGLRGYSTLLASLERGRTGTLGDIVATIQGEQDEIIRSPQAGVLVVQGGPGTGKTVVALHRAAYLLYTHRFPLEDQGVLVIGPNRLFLRYIGQVLPSLGEAGVEQVVLADLVPDVIFATSPAGDSEATARIKGDARMSDVIDRAIGDRERPLRDDLVAPFGAGFVRLTIEESARIVRSARRRFRRHNGARRWIEGEVWAAMAASALGSEVSPGDVRTAVRKLPDVRLALEWIWPVLSPAELLHDLFGSQALLRSAANGVLAEHEYKVLHRPRSSSVSDVRWSASDVALLDDAREMLGPVTTSKHSGGDPADEIRTYGHIVIDEVQDLTPMQLKMAARRSLNGSMTVVGDIAQATGALAPSSWDDVLCYLPDRKGSRIVGLSVGYRIPSQVMELAAPVMQAATPDLRVPVSVRVGDRAPRVAEVDDLADGVVAEIRILREQLPASSVAVVAVDERCDELSAALVEAGFGHRRVATAGLDDRLSVVPISVIKGLELDAVVVVEPAEIIAGGQYGMRSLYVALTRPTQHLSIIHQMPLPEPLRQYRAVASVYGVRRRRGLDR